MGYGDSPSPGLTVRTSTFEMGTVPLRNESVAAGPETVQMARSFRLVVVHRQTFAVPAACIKTLGQTHGNHVDDVILIETAASVGEKAVQDVETPPFSLKA